MKKLFKFLFLNEKDKLVRIVSLRPSICWERGLQVSWPAMLIDGSMGRMTVSPIWCRKGFRDLFWRLRGWKQEKRHAEAMKRDFELVTEWDTSGRGPAKTQYWREKAR